MNEDDDSQYLASNFLRKKAKEDDDSQYLAKNFQKKERKPGLLERAANDVEQYINKPVEEYVLPVARSARDFIGANAQGLANIVPGLANLGASGINALGGNIPKSPMLDVVPHSSAATAGDITSFFAAPGALNALSKVPQLAHAAHSVMKIPMIAQGIKHASNLLSKNPMASRIAGNAVLGGAYSPDNPLLGMELGAAGGELGNVAGKAIGKGISGAKNALENNEFIKKQLTKINPAAHQKELEHMLSGGSNNITQNSRNLTTDIRNAHKMREEEAGIHFNHALNSAGHEPIYNTHSLILNKPDESAKTMSMIKDLKVGDLFDKFKAEPTFENAHKLQSELGYMEREIQNRAIKTGSEKLELEQVNAARHSLKKDINNFLERRDLTSNQPIGPSYRKGSELYAEHVSPFLTHEKLLQIVRHGETDIKDLHQIFDTPSNKIEGGVEKIGAINKIMKDLPDNARERIIFDAIGGNKLSPEALMKKLNAIKSKGYESYFSPEIEESINALGEKLRNKKRLNTAATAGGTLGGGYGVYKGINAIKSLLP